MKLKYLASAVFACLLFFYSCSKSNNDPSDGTQTGGTNGDGLKINITGMAFPATTTIKKGSTVTWTNKDSYAHTVTSDDGSTFKSANLAAGATFSFKANTVGSFPYHCNYHSDMHGTLIVNP